MRPPDSGVAKDVDLFLHLNAEEAQTHRVRVYEGIYVPVLHVLEPGYTNVVHAIIRGAARRGLLANHYLSSMTAALSLREVFYGELTKVNQRLNNLEAAADNLGEKLFNTIKGLHGLQQRIKDKDERKQKVALIKSAFKLGVSLVLVTGGVLTVSIDAVTAFAEGAAGAKAVCLLWAEPADVSAAHQVFRSVRDARDSLTAEQHQALAGMLFPYKTMGVVVQDLESAAEALGVDTGAAADAMAGPAEGSAEEGLVESLANAAEGSAAVTAEGAEDEWGKLKEVAADAAVEHEVDWAAGRRRRRAPAPSVPSAEHLAAKPGCPSSQPAVPPTVVPAITGSATAAAPRATRGGGRPPPCAPRAIVSDPAVTALHAPLPPPAADSCAASTPDAGDTDAGRVLGRLRSALSPGRGAAVQVLPQPASLPQPQPRTAAASPPSPCECPLRACPDKAPPSQARRSRRHPKCRHPDQEGRCQKRATSPRPRGATQCRVPHQRRF